MAGGIALIGVGGYFLLLRPVLLTEDARYLGMSLSERRSWQRSPDCGNGFRTSLWCSGESRALQSKKRDFIEHVVAAINQAIVARC
jgi:hypothetical protein